MRLSPGEQSPGFFVFKFLLLKGKGPCEAGGLGSGGCSRRLNYSALNDNHQTLIRHATHDTFSLREKEINLSLISPQSPYGPQASPPA